jgi:hypothetical protein
MTKGRVLFTSEKKTAARLFDKKARSFAGFNFLGHLNIIQRLGKLNKLK